MSITDELREWREKYYIMGSGYLELASIADRIDAEHERCMADATLDAAPTEAQLSEFGYIELPKDADGEYIHAGEKLDGYGKTITVVEMRYGRSGWVLISEYGNAYADSYAFTHHHTPTVEDVLRDMHAKLDEVTALYVGEAIDSDERDSDEARIFAEYAAKLRLAGDAE